MSLLAIVAADTATSNALRDMVGDLIGPIINADVAKEIARQATLDETGSVSSIRERCASIISTGDISLFWTSLERSPALM